MMEKREDAVAVLTRLHEEDASGVRENPWLAHLRTIAAGPGGERRARLAAVVAQVGAPVLSRFPRLEREDGVAALAAATHRIATAHPDPDAGRGSRVIAPAHARIAHAVLVEAVELDRHRWIARTGADPALVADDLSFARRRAAALSEREGVVFAAVSALDDAAREDEVSQVVLRAAVAFQMRWNTAHQNVSRAWRRICDGTGLGEWCADWREGHRLVCGASSFEVWAAGRAYMDACGGRDGRGDEAFAAWVEAHEAHNAWFNEWKRQSARAARRWKDLGAVLDASGVRPARVQAALVRVCGPLGIDRWVFPIKLASQSWQDLLEQAHRPPAPARAAWMVFLREQGLGPAAEAAFRDLDGDASAADLAAVELEDAYRRLLAAAEAQAPDGLRARDTFRALVTSCQAPAAHAGPGDPR